MNDIAELQKIWMTKGDEVANGTEVLVPDSLMKKLKSLESFQNRINRLKMIVLLVVLVSMGFILTTVKTNSLITYLGFGVIIVSVVIFMIYYLKNQFKISNLKFDQESIGFTESTIKSLQKQISIFGTPAFVFFLSIVLGLNLMLWGLSENHSMDEKVNLYILDNVIVIVSYFIGYRVRKWRTKREVLPVMDELSKVKDHLTSEY